MNLISSKYSIEELEHYIANNELTDINWYNISKHRKLTEDFIEKYADKVDWYHISSKQMISEEFIEKYTDEVNWKHISEFQKLTEAFIEKNIEKVNWYLIVIYQKLSYGFLEKHLYRYSLNIFSTINNEHLDKLRVIHSHKYYIDKLAYTLYAP